MNDTLEAVLNEALMDEYKARDVVEVFKWLQAASRDHHLPAFQRCVERGGTPGGGPGFGRGRADR